MMFGPHLARRAERIRDRYREKIRALASTGEYPGDLHRREREWDRTARSLLYIGDPLYRRRHYFPAKVAR